MTSALCSQVLLNQGPSNPRIFKRPAFKSTIPDRLQLKQQISRTTYSRLEMVPQQDAQCMQGVFFYVTGINVEPRCIDAWRWIIWKGWTTLYLMRQPCCWGKDLLSVEAYSAWWKRRNSIGTHVDYMVLFFEISRTLALTQLVSYA